MERELNVELLENKDCCFTAVDSTRLPLDSNNKVNRAYIEFVVKDSTIVFNVINEAETESDILNNTIITTDSDGLYKYYKIVIPTLEFYKAGDSSYNIPKGRYFYLKQKVYRTEVDVTSVCSLLGSCSQITSIMDLWNLKEDDDNIYYASKEYFSICRLTKCFLSRVAESASELIDNGCNENCKTDQDLSAKRDFLLATYYVLKWLISKKDYDEATRILNIVLSCDDYLCPRDYVGTIIKGGCNCGRS